MELIFLGTGTSHGIPVIGCECAVCISLDIKDKRLRTSVYVSNEAYSFIIDTGPDFRMQMLKERIKSTDAIIFTHEHRDHIAGLDDTRVFGYSMPDGKMPMFAERRVQDNLKQYFPYIFNEVKYPGIPQIDFLDINHPNPFWIGDIKVTPLRVYHHKLPVLGFKFDNIAYITDANYIPDEEIEKIKNIEILIINALQIDKHISHFNLEEALEIIKRINPKKAYLTHISHTFGKHEDILYMLPTNIYPAYDGLRVSV